MPLDINNIKTILFKYLISSEFELGIYKKVLFINCLDFLVNAYDQLTHEKSCFEI